MSCEQEWQHTRERLRKQLKCYSLSILAQNIPECKTRRDYEDSVYSALITKQLQITSLTPPLDLLYLAVGTLSTEVRKSRLNMLSDEMIKYICKYYRLICSDQTEVNISMLLSYKSIPSVNVISTYTCEQVKILCRLYGCSIDKYATTPEQMVQHFLMSMNFMNNDYVFYDEEIHTLSLHLPPACVQLVVQENKTTPRVPPNEGNFIIQRKANRFTINTQQKENNTGKGHIGPQDMNCATT